VARDITTETGHEDLQRDGPGDDAGRSWSVTLNRPASSWMDERDVDDVARRVPVCSMS
jgi:hypothetical protein